jgi:hypothetical protein
MSQRASIGIFSGQLMHLIGLTLLLTLTWYGWCSISNPYPLLFWITISIPVAHQIFVWISWRTELKSKVISKSIGFKGYQILFFIFLIARPISHLSLAWVDQNSLGLNLILRVLIAVAFFIPAMYTMYSVKKYFSFPRAAGADHFDVKYRDMPLVKKGMFKFSNNSMYVFGFFMFWAIAFAFAFDSKAALLTSAFAHLYIWLHYYATEKPDMDYLYGPDN